MRIAFTLALLTLGFRPSLLVQAQPQAYRIDYLTTADGLPSNFTNAILQDQQGFLWFGTRGGLVKYDGYHFTTYLPRADDSTTIGDKVVFTLFEDAGGDLWVGGTNMLSRLDRQTGRFSRYRYDSGASGSPTRISAIYESPQAPGFLWIGTSQGLDRLDVSRGTFTHFRHNPADTIGLRAGPVTILYEAPAEAGILWIATGGPDADGATLYRFHLRTNRFESAFPVRFRPAGSPSGTLSSLVRGIYAMQEDRTGNLWMAAGAGLLHVDRETGTVEQFLPNPSDPRDFNNSFFEVTEDRRGTLWVGSWWGDVFRFDPAAGRFQAFEGIARSLYVSTILEDRSGVLWIGREDGLTKLTPVPYAFSHYRHDPEDSNSLSGNYVRGILQDRNGNLWFGNAEGGLDRLDPQTGRFVHYRENPAVPAHSAPNGITSIYEDRNGVLWIGDCMPPWELARFDPATERFTHYRADGSPGSLSSDCVNAVLEDRSGTLWIATWGGGLNRMDRRTGIFHHIQHDAEDPRDRLSTCCAMV